MIRFSKFNIFGLVLSLLVTSSLIGITVYRGGFNLGIDFRSGQSVEVSIPSGGDSKQVSDALIADFPQVVVTQLGDASNNLFNIKIASNESEQNQKFESLTQSLSDTFPASEVLGSSFIGGTLSKQLFRSAITLTLIALLIILLYIGLRFKFRFALAAVVALLHDALFVLGIIGALQIEISVSTVAAVLTIIGYSLNDTIVIFDRIRENIKIMKGVSFPEITDTAITRTLSRTIITTVTTVLAVAAIYVFTSGDIQNFAKTLLIGLFEGIWSSVFIATPVLYLFGGKKLTNFTPVRSSRGTSTSAEVGEKGAEQSTSQVSSKSNTESIEHVNSRADKLRQEIVMRKKKRRKKK